MGYSEARKFERWLAMDPFLSATPRPLDAIVERLGVSLDVESAFVGEVGTPRDRVRMAAWWKEGQFRDSVEYSIQGTPCARVIDGQPACRSSGILKSFPHAEFHRAERVDAYAAHPLLDTAGMSLGLIGVMSQNRFLNAKRIRERLAMCAPRVAGELVRGHEHETVISEVHHRVKNNLQVVASLLTMQAASAKDGVVERALSNGIARVSTVALIHAQLSERGSVTSVDIGMFIRSLVRNVQQTFANPATTVTFTLNLDRLILPLHIATPCAVLISELVTNALQHAFVGMTAGGINIQARSVNGFVQIVVGDDGTGFPTHVEQEEGHGLGLRLVQQLAVKQLRGEMTIERRGVGTEFIVRFPYRRVQHTTKAS